VSSVGSGNVRPRMLRPGGDPLGVDPLGRDPLGTAARLRLARLDAGGASSHLGQLLADAAVLLLLLAVPALATVGATVVTGAPPVVPAVACTLASVAVLAGTLVVWPAHDEGRTAGMRWTGLRLVDRRGAPPGRVTLAVRAAALPLDLLLAPAMVLLRADRRTVSDLLAGTRVVVDLAATGPTG